LCRDPCGAHPIPTSLPASSSPEERALAFLGRYGRAFGIVDTSQVQITRVQVNDEVGMDHVRLQQTHNGIPVTAGELTIHLRGGDVVSVLAKILP
jgi:Zn-dependent metalloprotease